MLRSHILEKLLFLFCLALFAGFLVWAVATKAPTGALAAGGSTSSDDESDNDAHNGRVWSDKAWHSRTILLGRRSKQPSPLGAGLMLAGGTESTQWFEVSVVTSSTTCVVIHATINTVLITPATFSTLLFHEVSIQGTDKTNFPGRPRLPVIPLIVAVDYQREIILSMTATGATTETEVLPIPSQYTDDAMDLVPRPFLMDEDIYSGGGYYPGTTGTISLPIIHGGIRCVHLNLLPIQCKPTDATITMYNSVTATLTYGTISTISTLQDRPQYVDGMLRGFLEDSIINYDEQRLQCCFPQGVRLLAIIAEDYWENEALHHLLDWHDYEGLKTCRIKARRDFNIDPGTEYENDRRARHAQRDWIRSEIEDLYDVKDQGLSTLIFVMLVGDVDPEGGVIQYASLEGDVVLKPEFLSWYDWDDYGRAGTYNQYDWLNWYQGDAGYGFQLNRDNPGMDVVLTRITGQLEGTDEITKVCNHSLGYATYQNNDVTSSEGWPDTAYGSDPAPFQGYHWLSKANVLGFKHDPFRFGPESTRYRFVRRSYRLWTKIKWLPGAPADATLINGQFEHDYPPPQLDPGGNIAVMYGRPDGAYYEYRFVDESGNWPDPRIYVSPRVNAWNDGLGLFFYVGHGNKCKWPCWNKIDDIDDPGEQDCIYCYESYFRKWNDGLSGGCPCATGTTIAVTCTFACGEDFNCNGQFDELDNDYKTPVVMSFSCLTAALKQIRCYMPPPAPPWVGAEWGPWGYHWGQVGAWNCPASEATCDCQGSYVVDDCYGNGTCSEFLSEVHGCPISERAVASYDPSTGTGGGAVAWFGTAGVYGAPDDSAAFYSKLVEGIWPSPENQHYQCRLGAVTWGMMMGLYAASRSSPQVLDNEVFNRVALQMMWIGDCALDVRTRYPMRLCLVPLDDPDFTLPDTYNDEITIVITMGDDQDHCNQPATGALLCFSQGVKGDDGNWDWNAYYVGMADGSGVVHIPPLWTVHPGPIRIVATRHNCRPELFWLMVTNP